MDGSRIGERARRAASSLLRKRRADRRPQAADEGRPPDWLTELDSYEDADDLSFALYSDIEDVVELRTGVGRRPDDE